MREVFGALWLGLSGCAWTVHAQADQPGAWAQLPQGERVMLPANLRLRYTPLHKPQCVVFGAPTSRGLTANLRETAMPRFGLRLLTDPLFRPRQVFGSRPRESVQVLLNQEHGPAGTWSLDTIGSGQLLLLPTTPVE